MPQPRSRPRHPGHHGRRRAGETFEIPPSPLKGFPVQLALPLGFEIGTYVVLGLILLFDLILAFKRPHVPSTRESALWIGFYVLLALIFAGLMLVLGDAEHAGQFV